MYARGDSIYRQKSNDNGARSRSGFVRSAKDAQPTYDSVCKDEMYNSNSGAASSVDQNFYEIYDGTTVTSNNEADDVAYLSSGMSSLQAGAPRQFSRLKGHAVPGAQKTANASRNSWMPTMSSSSGPGPDAAGQIAEEFRRRRQLLQGSDSAFDSLNELKHPPKTPETHTQSSDTGPMVTAQITDHPKSLHKLMSGQIIRLEPHQPPSTATAQPPYQEPIYASLVHCPQSADTASISSASTASSSSYTLHAAGTSLDESLDVESSATSSGAGLRQLPSICAEFATESECEWEQCPHLHVCADWVAGQCPVLRRCRRPHSLRTGHNMGALRDNDWQQEDTDVVLRCLRYKASSDRLEAARLPPICLDHARGGCRAQQCDALHICHRFLTGFCRKKGCTLGHDLVGTENNRRVLIMTRHEDVPAKKLLHKMTVCMVARRPRLL